MPDNQLVVLEQQLQPLAPRFTEVLSQAMPVERLIRTVVLSAERLPALLQCDRQSLFNAAMSAAVLGLEVDGVTGQAYLIPFKNRAQLVIGYKGYNTMAARSGITITGAVVREGDEFDYELGSNGYVRHKPKLGNSKQRIIGAWACATSNARPAVHAVMGIDELMAVKDKSPGAKRSDSPWNDPSIGFPAMCEKTVKRRLARSMPLNVMQLAARMDEAFDEQGQASWIDPRKTVVVEGEVIAPRDQRTPTAQELLSPATVDKPPANTAPTSSHQGEIIDGVGASSLSLEDEAREAARRGEEVFKAFFKRLSHAEKDRVQIIGDELRGLMESAS